MRKVLCAVIMVTGIFEASNGMNERMVEWRNIRAATVPANSDELARQVARQYIAEKVIDSSREVVVQAINEAGSRVFWREHGRVGNCRAYSDEIARVLLNKIANLSSHDMAKIEIVVQGIINGRIECTTVRLGDFTSLGINRSFLTRMGIWN